MALSSLASQLAQGFVGNAIDPQPDPRFFRCGAFSGKAYNPATRDAEHGWVEAWSQCPWLPGAAQADGALTAAQAADDDEAFKKRAKDLLERSGCHNCSIIANQQARAFVRMRKGDVVVTTDLEPSPKSGYREFSLGIASKHPTEAAWYDPTSASSLIGVHENDFDEYGAHSVPYAVRHVKWMRKGNWNALAPQIKGIVSGYTQACSEARDLDKACLVLKELIRVSVPVPAPGVQLSHKQPKAAKEAEEPAAQGGIIAAGPTLLLTVSSSSSQTPLQVNAATQTESAPTSFRKRKLAELNEDCDDGELSKEAYLDMLAKLYRGELGP